jgi:hypothetical protein
VVVDDNPDIWPFPPDFGDLSNIGVSRNRPIAAFVVANVVVTNAARRQVTLTLTPNSLPAVEEVDHHLLF